MLSNNRWDQVPIGVNRLSLARLAWYTANIKNIYYTSQYF